MLKEASLLAALRHPNVVLLLGYSIEMPAICLVTEFLTHGSLYDCLHPSKVSGGMMLIDRGGDTGTGGQFDTLTSTGNSSWESESDRAERREAEVAMQSRLPSTVPSMIEYKWATMKHILTGAARGVAFLHGCTPPVCHRYQASVCMR